MRSFLDFNVPITQNEAEWDGLEAKPVAGFREFYETYYHDQKPCVTTADEMRGIVCAYQQYRVYLGLAPKLADAKREARFAGRMEYHIGAGELAELTGDKTRTVKHREAFLEVWKLWFGEISAEETGVLLTSGSGNGFRKRFLQKAKRWRRLIKGEAGKTK